MTDVRHLTAGRELDALVVEKVMGWDMAKPLGSEPPMELPRYSGDIAAAWLVAEKMLGLGWGQVDLSRDWDSGKWTAGFGTWQEGGKRVERTGNTAPLAICLAALKAVGHA
jgi:hypothetical protein